MKILFHYSKWKFKASKFDDILRVKAKTAISLLFQKFKLIAGGSLSRAFIIETQIIAIKLNKLRRDQGIKGLTFFLKSCSVVLQQSLAGYRINDMTLVGPRVSRTNSGLPRIIPKAHRLIMINRRPGSYLLMRYYLSIFYVYRVLVFPGKVKLETITNPGKYYDENRFGNYMGMFVSLITRGLDFKPLEYLQSKKQIFPIFRSSPFTSAIPYSPFKVTNRSRKAERGTLWSTHVVALISSARALMSSDLYSLLHEFIKLLNFSVISDYFRYHKGLKVRSSGEVYGPVVEWSNKVFKLNTSLGARPLGKLSLKEEAAGKVRVFAMVDPFTQWILAPLHKLLFSLLRRIVMDGTFNQLKPIKRLLDKSKVKGLYSLDLSAATDRLPVRLQAQLLDHLIKDVPNFGSKWAALLVNRSYLLQSDKYEINTTVKYGVGQPMGALSSWAMLALIHHFIVQVAAWEVGYPRFRLFKDYAVLGDDLVIADHRVARRYLQILNDLGVECGLHKSILSRKGIGLEFAKSTFIDKVNVSPISLDELSVSITDVTSWVAFSSKYNLSWDRQMRILGHGYLARRKSFQKMSHALQVIYLTSIAKVDFNTDVLKLRRNAPKDFDTIYLEVFKSKVLFPLFRRFFKLYHTYPTWLKSQLVRCNTDIRSEFIDFDRYDLRNSFDLVMGASHQEFPTKLRDLIKSYLIDMSDESLNALLYFNFDKRVFDWMWPYLKINSFNEALQFYFKFNSEFGKFSYKVYGIDKLPSLLPAKKMPVQARFFRDFSLISHSIISTTRESLKDSLERDHNVIS